MKNSKFLLLVTFAVPSILFGAEPSAFGAGDLTSSQPYGLTSNEKVILETKKKLKKVAQKSNYQENQLDSLRERIDGLQSIVESLSRKAHNNKVKLNTIEKNNELSFKTSNEYEQRLAQEIQANSIEIAKLKLAIEKLSEVLDKVNLDYITKDEFNNLVNDINAFKVLMAKELKNTFQKGGSSKVKSADLYNQAKKYFDKKYYTKAIAAYEELIKRKYRPAYAHYMIGEMYYKRKDYAKAISYFKKSSKLYAKASYMPKLMLHTAIAMYKTGDRSHARAFFGAIVKKYPSSKEAKEAQKYLD
jgi:TolA-binding protein